MAPQFVKPYVKTNKHDAVDAEAICEAVSRPSMRFVPVKSGDQQAVLSLHRARQGFVKARAAHACGRPRACAGPGVHSVRVLSHVVTLGVEERILS